MRGVLGLLCTVAIAGGCGDIGGSDERRADDCPLATADCNDDPGDGCEADLLSPDSCGGCNIVCNDAPQRATPVCASKGVCDFICNDSTLRCDGECADHCLTLFGTAGEEPQAIAQGCSKIRIRAWGAGGGSGAGNAAAGAGGFVEAVFAVAEGDSLTVVVGAPGAAASGGLGGAGGAPGGGAGGNAGDQGGGGGGGFSGVFVGGEISVANALVIAGGGAGAGGGTAAMIAGGAGGGTVGQTINVAGGTQTTGHAALLGGPGTAGVDGGGGGGSGWFGGIGGNGANADGFGGGGGSGYVAVDAIDPMLATGDRANPGGAALAERGSAGNPAQAGLVAIDCLLP